MNELKLWVTHVLTHLPPGTEVFAILDMHLNAIRIRAIFTTSDGKRVMFEDMVDRKRDSDVVVAWAIAHELIKQYEAYERGTIGWQASEVKAP